MKMMKNALLALAATFLATQADAAGELMVHPKRIVFEGNTRTAQIDLINSGTEPVTYRISIVRRRMTDTGDFIPVQEPAPGEQFADEMIRFSPRQVLLQPGVAQAVRMQLRKPAGLGEGEYRSHLLFQALPSATKSAATDPERPSDEMEIRLIPIYSLSIPVIVRHGRMSAGVSIGDAELRRRSDGPPAVAMTLRRSGTRSVYGDLTIYLKSANGAERVLGRVNGVAIYTPNLVRRAVVPLPALAAGLPPGQLRITFAERPEQAGKVQAESRISVP